jgi:acetylornithine/succinyldiaminopimelate/putrescine aminotransferase
MRLRTQRRAIYAVMGLAVLAMIGGYALASFGMNPPTTVQQGSQTVNIGAVGGLAYESTSLVVLNASLTNTSCASSAAACNVSGAAATDCAGGVAGASGCLVNDFVEQVVLSTQASTPFSGNFTVQITLYATVGATTYTGHSFYYINKYDTAVTHLLTLDFGVGTTATGPGAVTSVSVVALN